MTTRPKTNRTRTEDPRERRGHVLRIETDDVPTDVAIDPLATEVLVIVEHAGAVLGQQWLPIPSTGVLRAEALTKCGLAFVDHAQLRDARAAVARSLGRPVRTDATRTITVVVCTHDRTEMLRGALESLLELRRPVELLVVDNRPSDDRTLALCQELGVRYVREDVPGASAGRNRGIRESQTDLVAFTDDDVMVSPDWLDHIDEAFDDPLVMVATGYIGPHSLENRQQVEYEVHGGFERHPDHLVLSSATHSTMPAAAIAGAGANMVLRRSVVEHIGGFDVAAGPGTAAPASEEKIFFYRVVEAGYRIDYDPRRVVWHRHRTARTALRSTLGAYTTGEFAWTAHMLRTRGDVDALRQWSWWGRHLAGDVRRRARGGPRSVSLALTASELAGIARAPRAYRALSSLADQSHEGGIEPSSEPTPAWATRRAPITWTRELPALSIAIASHNRRDQLERTLRALGEQDVPPEYSEVVVVLDGCTDGSAEMARSIETGFKLTVIEQPQMGFSGARHAGISAAEHPVVVMLDDDIVPLAGWLAAFGRSHAGLPNDAWVFGNHQPVLGNTYSEQDMRAWWSDHLRRKAQPGHRWTAFDCADGNSSMTVSWFRELGGFDPDLARRRQDYDLGFRHLSRGGTCSFADSARAGHFLTAGVESTLRIARDEGYGDVLLALKHPTLVHQLPMADPSTLSSGRGKRAVVGAALDDRRAIAAAARLERAGQRRAWRRLMAILWAERYRAGVRERLDELGLDAIPSAPERRRINVDLDVAGAADTLPADVHDAEFVLHLEGRPIEAVPALVANHQWDWDALVGRAAQAVVAARPLSGVPRA